MSGFIPDLRVGTDYPSDFYRPLVIVGLEVMLIDSG